MAASTWWGEDVMPRIRWRITVPGGEIIPDGYGLAYYEPGYDRAIAMPLPLNLIVGAWCTLVWHLKCPAWRFAILRSSSIAERAWEEGYQDGRNSALSWQPIRNPHSRRA